MSFSRFQAVRKYVKIEKETDNQGRRKRERLWIKSIEYQYMIWSRN